MQAVQLRAQIAVVIVFVTRALGRRQIRLPRFARAFVHGRRMAARVTARPLPCLGMRHGRRRVLQEVQTRCQHVQQHEQDGDQGTAVRTQGARRLGTQRSKASPSAERNASGDLCPSDRFSDCAA